MKVSRSLTLSDILGIMAVLDDEKLDTNGIKLAGVKHSKLVLVESAATLLRTEV